MGPATRLLLFVTSVLGASSAAAEVFKYVDAKGNAYFTDAPLVGSRYRLEWKRAPEGLVSENRERLNRLKPTLEAKPKGGPGLALGRVPAGAADGALSTRRTRFARLIDAYARVYGLSPDLLHAVIRTESAYNPDAVSHAGAQGLMQLMPGTAARYGVRDSFNPVENIRGGAAYLRDLLELFNQDLSLALAGYNAGENAVIRNGYQVPPYTETKNYVRQVLQHLWSGRVGG